MNRIIWTDAAKRHLQQIRAYISKDSPENATRFIKKIRNSVAGMKRFPEAGGKVPEARGIELREIFVGNYRVAYRVLDRTIEIVSVIHGARILPDSLGRS